MSRIKFTKFHIKKLTNIPTINPIIKDNAQCFSISLSNHNGTFLKYLSDALCPVFIEK